MSERDIFTAAREMTDAAARSAYLDGACGGDAGLRARVEALLRAHDQPDSLLDHPAVAPRDPAVGDSRTLDHQDGAPADDEAPLGFLEPATRADALGRLGHYEVLQVLGRGGFGIVFRAFDEMLQRVVALKVMAPQLAATSPARKRFLREARSSAQVRHENVVQVYEVAEQPLPYLAMEFIPGETLQQKLDRVGPLDVPEVLRIGRQIAEGLAAAHATDLIHRDIKPGNVLLEGGQHKVKITDFGMARTADDASISQSGIIAGTPMYMAPEQAEGKTLDQRADLFSLGSVLYQMVAGRPPFRANTTVAVLKRVAEDKPRAIREIIPETPQWLCDIIAKLHAKNPEERYQTAAEVAEVLEGCEQQMAAGVVPLLPGLSPPARRKWRVPVALAAVALAAVGAFLAWALGDRHDPPTDPGAERVQSPNQPEPWRPRPPLTPEELAKLPSPLDGRKRADIPPELLALAGGGLVRIAAAELVAVLTPHGPFTLPRWGWAHQPAVSPDGKWLAVASENDVALFDAATGALRRTLSGASQRIHHVAFAADGRRLGGSCNDGKAYVWDTESGKLELTLEGHPDGVFAIAFSPDGKRLATACNDGSLFLWDADGQNRVPLARQPSALHGLAFSADSKILVSAGNERVVVLWDTTTGTEKQSLKGHTDWVHNLCYSPDRRTLASGSDREVILWDLETGKPRHILAASGLGLVAFTPDGASLLAAGWGEEEGGYRLTRWDAVAGKQTANVPLGPRRKGLGAYRFYAASPDGTAVYACQHGGDDRVRVFDAATGKEKFPHTDFHTGPVWAVAVSPDGKTLATGGNDHTIRLWDLVAWQPGERLPPCRVLEGHTNQVRSLAFSRDGTRLASAGLDKVVVLWDAVTGKKLRNPLCRVAPSSHIAFHPAGNALAAGQEDGSVAVYDARTGEQRADWPAHIPIRAVAFSPDGKWTASCGGEDVLVTEWATGKAIRRLKARAYQVAFSPDGATLFAATDGTLRAWATAGWRERPVFPGQSELALPALAVHPGGRLVATGATDGSVVVRDLPTGRARWLAPGSEGEAHRVESLAFTPEGRYLVAASANGSVWLLRTPELPPPAEGPPLRQPIDLLALADTTRDALRGKWERRGTDLVCCGRAFLELPYQPPEEYDLTVRFTLHDKKANMSIHFPYAQDRCGRFGFEFDGGGKLLREFTDRTGTYWADTVDPNPAVPLSREMRVEVRRTSVRLVDNGVEWRRLWDGGEKAPPQLSASRDGGLPELHGSGTITCHKVEVRELSGRGWYPYGPPRP